MLKKIIEMQTNDLKKAPPLLKRFSNIINRLLSQTRPGHQSVSHPSGTQQISLQDQLFQKYDSLARAQGFNRLYVLLSFDCDTPEDIPAAEQVDAWLSERGIQRTYAVPGVQLQQGADIYRRLSDRGADFINHGARPHTEWRDGRYWSTTFYNEMTEEEVIRDIKQGHDIFCQVLGKKPVGFRAPHFGCFQTPEQLSIIHDTVRKLEYRFSTSTLPEFAFEHGPLYNIGRLYEIPLSGSYAEPYNILDSWNHVKSPQEPTATERYAELFTQTIDHLLSLKIVGVLNYYVDPLHVYNSPAFYQAISYLIERQVPSTNFNDLLNLVDSRITGA